ncbi:MAG TPA: DUF2157 domain-containing protein [Vicinamibacterales bacterium]|nr:DUF2157 domain-containing protein [Vicinamibacterales bacterium]
MHSDSEHWLERWSTAGLLDEAAVTRIRTFEQQHAGSSRLRWPILAAWMFGAAMIGGGVLLFVAAHWDTLSPGQRFSLVALLVGSFHVAGALVSGRSGGLSQALHAVGTVALGAGIALAGQIFHLEEHWPGGIMLWAIGAAVGWALLRHTPQMVLLALLGPAWLAGEWIVALDDRTDAAGMRVLTGGAFLLALTYFTAPGPGRVTVSRRALLWIGGLALPVASIFLAVFDSAGLLNRDGDGETLSLWLRIVGATAALGLPLGLAFALHRAAAWPCAIAALWVLALFGLHSLPGGVAPYVWWAIGAVGLGAWGLRDARSERINMGAAVLAATILTFYFSQVMDKLGRSASLVGFGILFLAGGWALDRVRRRLVLQAKGVA